MVYCMNKLLLNTKRDVIESSMENLQAEHDIGDVKGLNFVSI